VHRYADAYLSSCSARDSSGKPVKEKRSKQGIESDWKAFAKTMF
jgi:hypothetical protein